MRKLLLSIALALVALPCIATTPTETNPLVWERFYDRLADELVISSQTGLTEEQRDNVLDDIVLQHQRIKSGTQNGVLTSEAVADIYKAHQVIVEVFDSGKAKVANVTCRYEKLSGSNIRQRVCRSEADRGKMATASKNFLNRLQQQSTPTTDAAVGGGGGGGGKSLAAGPVGSP